VCFYLWCLYYHPEESHHPHKPTADVSHLVSEPLGFPGPFSWHFLKQSLKAMALKHLLVLDHSVQEKYLVFAHTGFTFHLNTF
jgi:hypothetical protein